MFSALSEVHRSFSLFVQPSIPENLPESPQENMSRVLNQSTDLTFGVEIEFALASICRRQCPHAEIEEEARTRSLYFEPTENDIKKTDDIFDFTETTIHEHIAKTLTDANHPCVPTQDNEGYSTWEVKSDNSIQPPDCPYDFKWFGIELTSPIFWFDEASLEKVVQVCNLIRNTYCVNQNETTGFHVHVGNGGENMGRFRFSTLRSLHALLWAFEPQLDTLHPSHRQNGHHYRSLRDKTQRNRRGEVIDPLAGVSAYLRTENVADLVKLSNASSPDRAYNFQPAFEGKGGVLQSSKKTIEFRQHEGTLDGARVTAWIRTVVGIVRFARDIELDPSYFTHLLLVAQYEEIGDREDARLCEGIFTVIDLLKIMELCQPALFYQERGFYGPYRPTYYWPQKSQEPNNDML